MVIYTLGVGTPSGSQIQIVNDHGQTEWLRDANGQVVHSRLDESTLRKIAEVTQGAYFPLGPLGEGLVQVQSEVTTMSARANATQERKLGVDRFHYPIALALVCLVGESLISTRRRKAAR